MLSLCGVCTCFDDKGPILFSPLYSADYFVVHKQGGVNNGECTRCSCRCRHSNILLLVQADGGGWCLTWHLQIPKSNFYPFTTQWGLANFDHNSGHSSPYSGIVRLVTYIVKRCSVDCVGTLVSYVLFYIKYWMLALSSTNIQLTQTWAALGLKGRHTFLAWRPTSFGWLLVPPTRSPRIS